MSLGLGDVDAWAALACSSGCALAGLFHPRQHSILARVGAFPTNTRQRAICELAKAAVACVLLVDGYAKRNRQLAGV